MQGGRKKYLPLNCQIPLKNSAYPRKTNGLQLRYFRRNSFRFNPLINIQVIHDPANQWSGQLKPRLSIGQVWLNPEVSQELPGSISGA
jgi:hypothetical protein